MAINPIVRYMLLCDDWRLDGANNRRITIIGLIGNIHSVDEPPYPLFYRQILRFPCPYGRPRARGKGRIVCVFEDTGRKVFEQCACGPSHSRRTR